MALSFEKILPLVFYASFAGTVNIFNEGERLVAFSYFPKICLLLKKRELHQYVQDVDLCLSNMNDESMLN